MTFVGSPYPAEVLATMVAICGTNGSAEHHVGMLKIMLQLNMEKGYKKKVSCILTHAGQ